MEKLSICSGIEDDFWKEECYRGRYIPKNSSKQIVITDKKEYYKGEIIRISIENNLEKPICFGSCNTYYFEKKDSGWVDYNKKVCESNIVKYCLNIGETRYFEYQILNDSYELEGGIYRVLIPICIDCSTRSLNLFRLDTIVYSDEFIIK
jgi:hypothetical protein